MFQVIIKSTEYQGTGHRACEWKNPPDSKCATASRAHLDPVVDVLGDGGVRVQVVVNEHHEAVVGEQSHVPHVAHVDAGVVGHAQVAGARRLQCVIQIK